MFREKVKGHTLLGNYIYHVKAIYMDHIFVSSYVIHQLLYVFANRLSTWEIHLKEVVKDQRHIYVIEVELMNLYFKCPNIYNIILYFNLKEYCYKIVYL